MERRKRVQQILESKSFCKELEELIRQESENNKSDPEHLKTLQRLSELTLPHGHLAAASLRNIGKRPQLWLYFRLTWRDFPIYEMRLLANERISSATAQLLPSKQSTSDSYQFVTSSLKPFPIIQLLLFGSYWKVYEKSSDTAIDCVQNDDWKDQSKISQKLGWTDYGQEWNESMINKAAYGV